MSTTTSTTTTTRDRGDRYGPVEWVQWQKGQLATYNVLIGLHLKSICLAYRSLKWEGRCTERAAASRSSHQSGVPAARWRINRRRSCTVKISVYYRHFETSFQYFSGTPFHIRLYPLTTLHSGPPGFVIRVDLRIQTYTEPVPLKYGNSPHIRIFLQRRTWTWDTLCRPQHFIRLTHVIWHGVEVWTAGYQICRSAAVEPQFCQKAIVYIADFVWF